VPVGSQLPERLGAVLAVVYLIFNEGYSGLRDQSGLAAEAIRLGRVLAVLLPAEPEVLGLLALMLLHDSRRETRFTGTEPGNEPGNEPGTEPGNEQSQDLVLLADQDRSRWDWRQIAEGRALLDRALGQTARAAGRTGPYVIQAAIASLQAAEELDWPQISVLYGQLAELTGSPVVRLNRAVAVAEADGPAAALAIVDQLDLPGYQYWHSTRAELLRRLGRRDEARSAYRRALDLARTAPERRFLERRIAES
jgi:RNA polymerase sigma-70 factor (ECF subfamily)